VDLIDSEIDRMHIDGGAGSSVKKLNLDLSFMPDTISTDYITHEGFALTNEYLFLVVDDFVVKYDSRLVDLVHRYGRYARVHCHGKVKTAIHKLLKMGADMLNPVEAPPNGDIEIHEAKKIVKGKMTLEGNIQFSDLEFAEEEQINILVKNAVCDGGKDRFILTATEWPLTYLSGRLKKNYIQFIKSGIEYGKLN
ncbi:MAG: hypothetical protein KAJ15_10175, partial [Spirochaetes bacterium]|nr:hypothetical protein [Spirochaetota bacterium]